MSKDWKTEMDKKICEAFKVPEPILDIDVADLYPKWIPARGSAKTHPVIRKILKREINRIYGKSAIGDAIYGLDTSWASNYENMNRSAILHEMKYMVDSEIIRHRDFDYEDYIWKISDDILVKLRPDSPWIVSDPRKVMGILVKPVYGINNCIELVRKDKEVKNMGLENDLILTKGEATININGCTYPVSVDTIRQDYGEPTKLEVYVRNPFVELIKRCRPQNSMTYCTPQIDKVIFNDPATIVYWKDGTKTVVQARDEKFDPEKGLAMAISKKAMGNTRDYYIPFKKWLKKFKKEHPETVKLYADDQVVAEFPVSRKDD